MAVFSRAVLWSVLFNSPQGNPGSLANKLSKLYFNRIYKAFCSKTTPQNEQNNSSYPHIHDFLEPELHEKDVDEKYTSKETTGKALHLVVSSLRVDRVAATGFGIGRRKLDLLLLSGKLYLNKNKVEKRSLKVNCDDILELVSKEQYEDSKVYISRLKIDEIGPVTTKKGNLRISLTRHRNIIIDRGSYNQLYRKKRYK